MRILLEPVEPKRRVDRHRHPACEQDAEEAREEGLLGAQHERDGLANPEVPLPQTRRHGLRPRPQLPVGDRPFLTRVLTQQEVCPVRVALGLPHERFDEAPRRTGRGDALAEDRRGDRERLGLLGCASEHRRGEVGDGVRRHHHIVRQPDAEGVLDPEQQLDPLEAPEPEIAVERIAGNDLSTRNRAQLGQQAENDRRELLVRSAHDRRPRQMRASRFCQSSSAHSQKHPTAAYVRGMSGYRGREESEPDGCHENLSSYGGACFIAAILLGRWSSDRSRCVGATDDRTVPGGSTSRR